MCELCSFITQVDTGLHGGILGICAVGGQQDIYLTAPASVQCLELTMSVVMGINNADPWPDKNSLSSWRSSQHCAICSTHISIICSMWVECWGFCRNEIYIPRVNRMTDTYIPNHSTSLALIITVYSLTNEVTLSCSDTSTHIIKYLLFSL